MLKTFGAVAAAALIAAALTVLTGTADVSASTTPQPAAATDTASAAAPACTRGWPYVEAGCLRKADGRPTDPRPVRRIGIDRI